MASAEFVAAVCAEAESCGVDCGGVEDAEDVMAAMEFVTRRIDLLRADLRERALLDCAARHVFVADLDGYLVVNTQVDTFLDVHWWCRHAWDDPTFRCVPAGAPTDDAVEVTAETRPGKYVAVDVLNDEFLATQTLEDAVAACRRARVDATRMREAFSAEASSVPGIYAPMPRGGLCPVGHGQLFVVLHKTPEGKFVVVHREPYDEPVYEYLDFRGKRAFSRTSRICFNRDAALGASSTLSSADEAVAHMLARARDIDRMFEWPYR